MAFSKSQWYLCVMLITVSCLRHTEAARDICSKFAIGGPCLLLQRPLNTTSTSPSKATIDNAYCRLACSQGKAELFSSICPCATDSTTVATTVILTTTPQPVTCYYSTQRQARLSNMARRMYSSTPVLTECDYPGVVGLFMNISGTIYAAGVGSLLDEDLILVSSESYANFLNNNETIPIYVMADSYTIGDLTMNITVDRDSVAKLDMNDKNGYFYTAKLSSNLTFDKSCIQPACFPNINIHAKDLDLDDCRMVGYSDGVGDLLATERLTEIQVRVIADSIRNMNLTIERTDNNTGIACIGDEGVPLICSHITTKEWVTVGLTMATGYPCEDGSKQFSTVTNLLQESRHKMFYNAIQRFKYTDPNKFPADRTE